MSKRKWIVMAIFIAIIFAILIIGLWREGIFIPNSFKANNFPVKGIDVSSYQGEINWSQIEEQANRFCLYKSDRGELFC
jgi:lysozyme